MIGRYTGLGCLALAFVLLGGCASTDTPDNVQIEPSIRGWIEIENLYVDRRDSGLLEVHVTARNRVNQDVKMNYQFDWLDDGGRQVASGSSRRKRVAVEAMRRFTMSGVAPNERVSDFRLYVEGRDTTNVDY